MAASMTSFGLGGAVRRVRLGTVAVEVRAMECDDGGTVQQDDLRMREQEARVRAVGYDGIVLTGTHVRDLRLRLRLPVRVLAARLHYSRAEIYAWECGRHPIPPSMYLPILEVIIRWRQEQEDWQQLVADAHARVRA